MYQHAENRSVGRAKCLTVCDGSRQRSSGSGPYQNRLLRGDMGNRKLVAGIQGIGNRVWHEMIVAVSLPPMVLTVGNPH
jgi:hypothetical protein